MWCKVVWLWLCVGFLDGVDYGVEVVCYFFFVFVGVVVVIGNV